MSGPSLPFGRQGERTCPKEAAVELATGRELLIFAMLLFAILAVMWLLATTRRSPR
jgi:hypothetical protein